MEQDRGRSRIRIAFEALGVATALSASGLAGVSAGADGPNLQTTIYTMSNAAASGGGNAILAFERTPSGLSPAGIYPTGGNGTGAPLGSQGAVALTERGSKLLVVNAGSNSVSEFWVDEHGRLTLLGSASTGSTPISVTASGDIAYVLNSGDNSVSGYWLGSNGIKAIPGSTRSLSPGAAAPVQISFSPRGEHLIVTEKASNTIDVFSGGAPFAGPPTSNPSDGVTPFGFDFNRRGDLVVSDAAGGAANASGATSYHIGADGVLHPVNALPDGQTAACWLTIDRRAHVAYAANAGSGTISSYDIGHDGTLTLRASVAATVGGHPVDETVAGHELFVLISPGGRISMASVAPSGDLGPAADGVTALPAGTTGLVSISRD